MNETKFIKILDENVANSLREGGFSYMKEKINDGQDVFVFESTDELWEALKGLSTTQYADTTIVFDDTLHF